MRLLLVTHYWPPEYGPDPPILHENAKHLQAMGVEVDVVAALPSYPSGIVPRPYRNKLFMRENVGGVSTLRTWTFSGPRERGALRVANQVSFDVSCLLAAVPPWRRYDHVLAVTPPLTLIPSAWLLSRMLRARFSLQVMDLHPEAAVSAGLGHPYLIPPLRGLARFGYEKARVIITASELIKEGVEAYGIEPRKVHFIPNGIDVNLFRPLDANSPVEGLPEKQAGSLWAVFAGTMGRAHDVESILQVASQLHHEGDPRWSFLLVGAGGQKRNIARSITERGLRNVKLMDPIPREHVPHLLARADAVLVTLRDIEISRMAIPTKMYDGMACGRPIILGTRGEARRVLMEADAGIAIEPEDAAGLLAALRRLQAAPLLGVRYGANGRRYAVEHYSRERCAARLHALLSDAVEPLP